jgi:acyl carrier protein
MAQQVNGTETMNNQGIGGMEGKIRELFATMLQIRSDEIHDGMEPMNVDRWDSMQHLILVSGFEEEFGLDVDPEEAVEMYSDYGTFKRIVLRKMGA